MKSFLLTASVLFSSFAFASSVRYFNQVELPYSATQIQLVDAEYVVMPTKSVVQNIPDCVVNTDSSLDCTQTVVLESEPVIRANIAYADSFSSSEDQLNYTAIVFKLSDFAAGEVEYLKANSPQWQHPFSDANRKFAKNNLTLTAAKAVKTIQIVDTQKSKLCPENDAGMSQPGCVERLVYKESKTPVIFVTVKVK